MNTSDVHALLARMARDLHAALVELRTAYDDLDEAQTKEKAERARRRVKAARENLTSCLACYQSLRAALSGGTVGG